MKWSFKLALVAVACHLALVVAGTQKVALFSGTLLGRVLLLYSMLSGADSYFGFFAPDVGSQLRTRFEFIDREGRRVEDVLRTQNDEKNFRIGNLTAVFWGRNTNEELQRSLAASWAGKVFWRNPTAKQVIVNVDAWVFPSMREYREGKRSEWTSFYQASFRREAE